MATIVVCLLLSAALVPHRILGEKILGEQNEEFDFDGMPGAQHEFKIEVPAGGEECFFQKIAQGAKLHVSFEVLRGGDRNVDMYVKDPHNQILDAHYWKSDGGIEKDITVEGVYKICIDNTFSRFASKLVYVYLITFVMDEWSRYVRDIAEIVDLTTNFTTSLQQVQGQIGEMLRFQGMSRMNVIRDWYLIQDNNKYVQYWSITQVVVILGTSLFQLFFVRRLFSTTNVTPTAKPRA